jgi:NADPH2:quinone reductase
MRAWLLDELRGLSALRLADVPEPEAKAGEVVLRVHYAALNPADRYLAERQYPAKPKLPHILGRDGLGTVVKIGSGVTGVAVGDRRILLRGEVGVERPGTFAEQVAVPVESLAEVPAGWDEREAAGATLVFLTAHQALTMWGPLGNPPPASGATSTGAQADDQIPVVLVTGASGGVGVATVQLAAAFGYTVVALSRSEEKRARLRQLGAAYCFNPEESGWALAVKRALGSRRVDLVVDNVGGGYLPAAIDTLGNLGKVSLVGRLAGPVPSFNTATLFFRRIRMGGVAMSANTPQESSAAWHEVRALLARTHARPLFDSVHPFDRLLEAFDRLEKGPMGKVLLAVNPPSDG